MQIWIDVANQIGCKVFNKQMCEIDIYQWKSLLEFDTTTDHCTLYYALSKFYMYDAQLIYLL